MIVIDPGHEYELDQLDSSDEQILTFVKRQGPKYPGNDSAYPGTTVQEVLRACIDRLEYVYNQTSHPRTDKARNRLIRALYHLEARHAELHGLENEFHELVTGFLPIATLTTCGTCGHLVCRGHQ